ncbi:MAG: type II secretion system F family protein [Candidatus Peregrinibacteria bacterium]|nr:type II secretion system F family protein [Candidatus Peregrinibacteria bacterium]MDZ4244392.1 type II secretion system F family protein [Candidatus Gracilibacteria bacterium]
MEKKSLFQKELSIGGINATAILLFTKHLAITIKSGLTLVEGLEILLDQSKGKMESVLIGVLETVRSGKSFSEALCAYTKYFSPIYINMVRTGELSGTLEDNLARLVIDLNKAQILRRKIKSAMIYPMFVFVAVFGLGMSVALFVLPKILPLFRTLDVELPITTRGLIWVAEVFENHGFSLLVGTVLGVTLLLWLLRRDFVKPFTHRLILKIPVVKTIVRNINLERFTRTFGTLLESGLPLDQSLQITADAMENRAYHSVVLSFLPEVKSGNSLLMAVSKHPKLFPMITSRMIGVGEKTGNLDNTLKYLAGFYEDEVDETTKNLSTVLEPVLLIVIGIIVGTVAISILGPIYQITGNLSG